MVCKWATILALSLQDNRAGHREAWLWTNLFWPLVHSSIQCNTALFYVCHYLRKSWNHCHTKWLCYIRVLLLFFWFLSCNWNIIWHSYVSTYRFHSLVFLFCCELRYQITRFLKNSVINKYSEELFAFRKMMSFKV